MGVGLTTLTDPHPGMVARGAALVTVGGGARCDGSCCQPNICPTEVIAFLDTAGVLADIPSPSRPAGPNVVVSCPRVPTREMWLSELAMGRRGTVAAPVTLLGRGPGMEAVRGDRAAVLASYLKLFKTYRSACFIRAALSERATNPPVLPPRNAARTRGRWRWPDRECFPHDLRLDPRHVPGDETRVNRPVRNCALGFFPARPFLLGRLD